MSRGLGDVYKRQLENSEVGSLLPDDVMALANAFPVLGRVDSIAMMSSMGQSAGNPAELQRRAFAALAELINRLAQTAPLVLYIDDLQWGDVESAAFLAQLLGPDGPRLLFVVGFRSEYLEISPLLSALFSALGSHAQTSIRVIEVGPLAPEVLEFLAAQLLEEKLPGGTHTTRAKKIAQEAKGNPYFVHELVRYALSHPESEDQEGTSLASVIQARAGKLSAEAQRLLRVISLAGLRMTASTTQQAAKLGVDDGKAFVELRAGHFVRGTGTGESDTIEPYQDRVRESMNASLSETEASETHLSIAEA